MKQENSLEKVTALFNSIHTPEIDLTDKILPIIREEQKRKGAFFMKKKVGLITAACLVMFVSVGYAAVNMYQLHNSKGETVYQEKKIVAPPSGIQNALEEYQNKLNLVRDNLRSGSAAAVYIVSKDPLRRVATIQKPFVYTNAAEIQTKIGKFVTIPTELKTGFTYKEGEVYFQYAQQPNNEALFKEAEQSKKEVVSHSLLLSKEINFLNCTYTGKNGTFTVTVYEHKKEDSQIYTPNRPDEQVEKVKVNKEEALYKTFPSGPNAETKELIWVNSNLGRKYMIQTTDQTISKLDLVAIADQFSDAQ